MLLPQGNKQDPMPTASPNPPSTPDDRALVDAALMGSPVAFDCLVERYHSMVYLIGYARLGSRESAEDLAQEVFLRIFLNLRQFDRRYDFAPWIGRIARNLATDWLRRGQSASRLVKMVPLDDTGGQQLPDDRTQGAREKMETEERDAAVREAVFALPPDQRELVLLHYAEELSQQDIAARLGVHPATVSRQMRKAMKALRQSIEPVLVDWVRTNHPKKQATARTLALIGATAALSVQAKSAVAAVATIGQYAASAKTGATAVAGAMAGASGLASFLASLGAWIAGGVKVMAFWKTAAVIVTGVGLVGGVVSVKSVSNQSNSVGLQEWKKKFHITYQPNPVDTIRYVAPPFIPEREVFIQEKWKSSNPDAAVFIWNGEFLGCSFARGGNIKLCRMLEIIGLKKEEYDGPAELLDQEFPGDWVISKNTPREDILKGLEGILNEKFNAKIQFKKQTTDREVIMAQGILKYYRLPASISNNLTLEHPIKRSEKLIHVFANPGDGPAANYGADMPVDTAIDIISGWINYPIILEPEPKTEDRFSVLCHIQTRRLIPLDPQILDKVLTNLSLQTCLQFTKERRRMEVWTVSKR